MSVLIDTPIWSLALRRRPLVSTLREQRIVAHWAETVRNGDAVLIGPICQELLSGLRSRRMFHELSDRLADFPDLLIERDDYVQAAAFFNICRARGIAGSAIDLLLCAVAWRHNVPIFTTDSDFERYAMLLPITHVQWEAEAE